MFIPFLNYQMHLPLSLHKADYALFSYSATPLGVMMYPASVYEFLLLTIQYVDNNLVCHAIQYV